MCKHGWMELHCVQTIIIDVGTRLCISVTSLHADARVVDSWMNAVY